MISCSKCRGRMFVDRVHTASDHMEIFCVTCGMRIMFHPPAEYRSIKWLVEAEGSLLKSYNGL